MTTFTQQAKIIKAPYLLFTGANGHKCYGIKVQSIDNPANYKIGGHRYGDAYEYEINDYSLLKNPDYQSWLGLTMREHEELLAEIKKLSEAQ